MRAKLRALGFVGRIVERIDFTRLPLALQIDLYVVARKERGME
jgi:hypothetical protein